MKKFLQEFKEFAVRGSVIDMAVGVVIGTSFKGIIDSFVKDLISPIIGLVANQDFSDSILSVGDVQIKYGAFLTTVINFVLMALVVFLLVKAINFARSLGKKDEPAVATAPSVKICPFCKSEINIEATRCGFCTSHLHEE